MTEARRLESLWSGTFGDAYTERNRAAGERRAEFWATFLRAFPSERVLEVGCNVGANLRWIAEHVPPRQLHGLDVNVKALTGLRRVLPAVNGVCGRARELPFRDRAFDTVLTMGVLIHQPTETLPAVMAEIVRCAGRFVLCGEYYAPETTEVPYRGESGALFKRDFGALYRRSFPELRLRAQGFLSRGDGWDDITYWVFERAPA